MTDLNLRLRLTADGTQVQSAVRSATAALDSMSQSAKNAGISGISAAQATDRIQQSAASAARSATGASAALSSAASAIRALMGSAPAAARGLSAVSHDVRDVAAASSQADVAVQRLGSQLSSLSRIAQAALGYLGAREIVRAADEWTNIGNRLRLVTDSAAALASAQSEVFRIAREGRQSLAATAELYQRIATNQEAMGLTTAGLNRVTETISKTLAISGSSAQSAEAALIQLGQAFNSGVLRGEELNSVMEQAPALARAIADGMGKTTGELRALGEQGLLTSQQVVDALLKQGAAVDEQFGRIAPTVSQAWTVLGNAATQIVGRMGDVSGASGGAAQSILNLADTLSSPEMIQSLNAFAAGAAEAFRVAVESVGTFVNAIRWLGEEVAARLHGVALNDIVRMREQLREAQAELDRNTAAMSRFYAAQAPAESERAAREIWLKQEAQLRETRNQAFAEVNALTEAIQRQEQATGKAAGALSGASSALEAYTTGTTRAGALSKDAAREAEKLADSLERIRRAADPAYASMMQFEETAAILENAMSAGLIEPDQFREILNGWNAARGSAASHAESAKAAARAQKEWADSAMDAIDPLRRFEREAKKVREAFSKGELGDTTASQVEEYLKRLRKQAQGTGDALKDAFNAPGKAINEFAEGTGKAVGSLREMFKEGDSGYKALTIGLNALNAMQAINAVLNQSAGDPYTAFARMATMAATVAALGYSVGMGGGGSDRTAANRQAEQGAGSVLGDATAKTESIARATEITADATTALVGLNRSMLVALQGLQAGIAGAVTRIARGAGDVKFDVPGGWSASQQRLAGAAVIAPGALAGTAFQSLQLGSAIGSTILGPIGAVAGALGGKEIVDRTLKVLDKATLGALSAVGKLIGGSSKQVDEGITVVGGTLAELIDETMVSAYATIKSKKYKWSSSKYNDVTSVLDADVGRQFELVFQGIAESVTAGAAALGLEQTAIDAAVSGYVVESLRISLQGLKPEEQREALDAVFGKVFDGLAETVIPYIADFTAYGEGLGETLARVANAVMVTEDVVDRLGVRFQQLAGADLADASLRLVELAGGIEELARNSAGFLQNFATPERQMEVITRDLERALGQVNLQLPASRDGFYDLVQAQDASTQSGAEAIATLLRVQAVAADYYDRIERMISDELEARLQANAIVLRAAQDGLAALRAEVTGVSSAAASLSQQMTPAAVQRDAARQVLSRALTTGDFSGAAAAAASVAQIRASDYASELEFRREQANTLSLLRLVEREGALQIDYAAAAVDAITAQTDAIRDEAKRGRDHLEALLAERSDQTRTAGVPGFASGGVHAGGWRVVGEHGPELEFTGPSRIYSHAQSRALFDTTELLAELRAISDRVSRIEGHSMHISTSTRLTSRVIERWEIGGLPQERTL